MAQAKARLKKEKAEEKEEEELLGSPAKADKQNKAQKRVQKVSCPTSCAFTPVQVVITS